MWLTGRYNRRTFFFFFFFGNVVPAADRAIFLLVVSPSVITLSSLAPVSSMPAVTADCVSGHVHRRSLDCH